MNGFLILRLLIGALTLVLAVVLIARGNVLIGVLVGALALSRLLMLGMIRRRRKELVRRFPRRGNNDV